MKCYSLFAGVGGFDLALKNKGHTIVGACEIDKYARQTYRKNFGEEPEQRDATKIIPEQLPDFDLLCAGFPCQAFSIAGRRLGFEESRGTLFFEIARIARERRPRYLLLENVKGLLSHDRGKTFANILATLDELGYDAEWQVLNSKYFVPQNRERIFIIGYLRGECRPEVFPVKESCRRNNEKTIKYIRNSTQTNGRIYSTKGIARALTSSESNKTGFYAMVNDKGNLREVENSSNSHPNYWKGIDNHGTRTMIVATRNLNRNGPIVNKDRTFTITKSVDNAVCITGGTKQPHASVMKDMSPTLKAGMGEGGGNIPSILGDNIRRLTPLECERLQGFPDNYTEGVSDTQRYRQMGNAVTVPVVEYILERLVN